ncbi:FG-GAP-like repeat-containing protein [Litorimonas sp.]|uniref:FG-GAP-like repeat-containing protein n=1 Tax=Litorimonas sp. TaxID=1892381 RepID=UPI003A874A54
MHSFIKKGTGIRFILAFLLLALITYFFWTSSRYPALDDKAMMAGEIHLEDPLSFEAHWTVDPDFPIWKKIIYTTGNWIHTNRKGMFFGILIGSAFLTLMRYLARMSFKNAYTNAFLGMFLGAPLGVCVNCAAPIAKGLYKGGARVETMLAAMIASPTLNIVVLTMLFSILPFYLAITKLVLCFVVILIVVPTLCFWLREDERQLPVLNQRGDVNMSCEVNLRQESLGSSVVGFTRDYISDLWYIIKLTLPLMILAGFLGAIVATLIPLEMLNNLKFGLLGLLIIALIGTFLPVPIAFDVVICGALLAGGLAVGSVMTLLFTLGIFSIYSFFIVGQSVSVKIAGLLGAAIILIGAGSGFAVSHWHASQTENALEILQSEALPLNSPVDRASVLLANNDADSDTLSATLPTIDAEIIIESVAFNSRSKSGEKPFTRLEAQEIGISQPIEFSIRDMWPPFWEGRSISGGDIDLDGDNDLVLASTVNGLYFYKNDGQGKFEKHDVNLGKISDWPIFNAALVDFNNDGWLDIFLTTYQKGNYILWNQEGLFSETKLTAVKNNPDALLSLALSFGDVDKDGYIDSAIGNWAAGWYRRIPGEESRNRLIINDKGRMSGDQYTDLPGLPGETLSILLSDINGDANLDLLVGNDFEVPDFYYYGDGQGEFSQIFRNDNVIPFTTNTTMGIKTHDLDNDLIPEIYSVQIAGRASGISDRLNMQPIENYCASIKSKVQKDLCQKNMDIKSWYKSGNNFNPSYAKKCLELDPVYMAECKAMLIKDLAIQAQDPELCELIKLDQSIIKSFCNIHFKPSRKLTVEDLTQNLLQVKKQNVLLKRKADGRYDEVTNKYGLGVGGWSWDTKIADFNNDEWSDVFIVNGTWVPNDFTPSNMFYLNDGAAGFSEKAVEYGLEDYLMTAAALRMDIDHDGDLDILTVPVNGPVQAYINNEQMGQAIGFRLRDKIGNRYGLGAKIKVYYGPDGNKHQRREIQSGGGFQSFDSSDVHFGLGANKTISRVEIDWVDGSSSVIDEPLKTGATYIVTRETF